MPDSWDLPDGRTYTIPFCERCPAPRDWPTRNLILGLCPLCGRKVDGVLASRTSVLDASWKDTAMSAEHAEQQVSAWLADRRSDSSDDCVEQYVSPVLSMCLHTLHWGFHHPVAGQSSRSHLLVPFVSRVVGTADDGLDEARVQIAGDWVLRFAAPAWLELAGLVEHAALLRNSPPPTTSMNGEHQSLALACEAARHATRGEPWSSTWNPGESPAGSVISSLPSITGTDAAAYVAEVTDSMDVYMDAITSIVEGIEDELKACRFEVTEDTIWNHQFLRQTIPAMQDHAIALLERLIAPPRW